MKGLLLKEWYNLRSSSALLFVAGCLLLLSTMGTTGWGLMMACAVAIVLLCTVFPYDEYKWTQTVLTSPLGWPQLIAGKYLFCLLCGAAMATFWLFCHGVFAWSIESVGVPIYAWVFFNYFVLLCSVYIPCVYCLKHGMAHLILLLTYLLLLACGGLNSWHIQPDAGAALGWFSLLTVAALLISILITCKIFQRKYETTNWRNKK